MTDLNLLFGFKQRFFRSEHDPDGTDENNSYDSTNAYDIFYNKLKNEKQEGP